ncbi:hypothetical protein N7G274_006111 [Stereocaulon virgatum]|uniref:Uncharacterized protein n=1 Tax=Stereocaulon virgatum TaxID=373712 RepID=A0ABR4A5I5_9LECA
MNSRASITPFLEHMLASHRVDFDTALPKISNNRQLGCCFFALLLGLSLMSFESRTSTPHWQNDRISTRPHSTCQNQCPLPRWGNVRHVWHAWRPEKRRVNKGPVTVVEVAIAIAVISAGGRLYAMYNHKVSRLGWDDALIVVAADAASSWLALVIGMVTRGSLVNISMR